MGIERFIQRFFLLLGLLFLSLPALSEGLVVSTVGGGVVLDADLTELGRFSLKSQVAPKLAVHPAAPILATLTPEEGLVFWNLPQVSEASRHSHPLFREGIRSISFSSDGNRLYALSDTLRAVVIFELDSSKVVGMIPVPGGELQAMQVTSAGLLIEQDHAVSVLSSDPEQGLLAQFRFPIEVLSGVLLGERVYLTLRGVNGVWAYQYPSGRTLGLLPTPTEVTKVLERADGLVFVTTSGLESQSTSGAGHWSVASSSGAFEQVATTVDKRRVFALESPNGLVLALDSGTGQELFRVTLAEAREIVSF